VSTAVLWTRKCAVFAFLCGHVQPPISTSIDVNERFREGLANRVDVEHDDMAPDVVEAFGDSTPAAGNHSWDPRRIEVVKRVDVPVHRQVYVTRLELDEQLHRFVARS